MTTLTALSMEQKGDYLNPERVIELSKKCKNEQCKHAITCYYNGLWWACPNPYNKRHKGKGSIEDSYKQGYFIKRRNFPLSDQDFQNHKNWNS